LVKNRKRKMKMESGNIFCHFCHFCSHLEQSHLLLVNHVGFDLWTIQV
jgi:hypothetical protein